MNYFTTAWPTGEAWPMSIDQVLAHIEPDTENQFLVIIYDTQSKKFMVYPQGPFQDTIKPELNQFINVGQGVIIYGEKPFRVRSTELLQPSQGPPLPRDVSFLDHWEKLPLGWNLVALANDEQLQEARTVAQKIWLQDGQNSFKNITDIEKTTLDTGFRLAWLYLSENAPSEESEVLVDRLLELIDSLRDEKSDAHRDYSRNVMGETDFNLSLKCKDENFETYEEIREIISQFDEETAIYFEKSRMQNAPEDSFWPLFFVNRHTPFFVAVSSGCIDIVEEYLVQDGLDGESLENSFFAVNQAILNAHLDVLELLLENGAEINDINYFGSRPIVVATRNNNLEAFKLLEQYGAEKDVEDFSLMEIALSHKADKVFDYLGGDFSQYEIDLERAEYLADNKTIWRIDADPETIAWFQMESGFYNYGQQPLELFYYQVGGTDEPVQIKELSTDIEGFSGPVVANGKVFWTEELVDKEFTLFSYDISRSVLSSEIVDEELNSPNIPESQYCQTGYYTKQQGAFTFLGLGGEVFLRLPEDVSNDVTLQDCDDKYLVYQYTAEERVDGERVFTDVIEVYQYSPAEPNYSEDKVAYRLEAAERYTGYQDIRAIIEEGDLYYLFDHNTIKKLNLETGDEESIIQMIDDIDYFRVLGDYLLLETQYFKKHLNSETDLFLYEP